MSIVFDWIIPIPRARRRDPATSHAAAHNARRGAAQALRERIYASLAEPATARELVERLHDGGDTARLYFAIQRRLSECPGIHRTGEVRDGCAVWARDDGCLQ